MWLVRRYDVGMTMCCGMALDDLFLSRKQEKFRSMLRCGPLLLAQLMVQEMLLRLLSEQQFRCNVAEELIW